MARPQNLTAYGNSDVAQLAASYDGNKRTAFVAMELFLILNGHKLCTDDQACVLTMLKVAAGELSEKQLAT